MAANQREVERIEQQISESLQFSTEQLPSIARDVFEISSEMSRRTSKPVDDTVKDMQDLLTRLEKEPESWRKVLADNFNDIYGGRVSSVLRGRQWYVEGPSEYASFSMSSALIEKMSSTADYLRKKAVNLFRRMWFNKDEQNSEEDDKSSEKEEPSKKEEEEHLEKEEEESSKKEKPINEEKKVQGIRNTAFKKNAEALVTSADYRATGIAANNFNATATGLNASATANATGIAANNLNASATGANFSASAKTTAISENCLNASAQGFNASASLSATGVSADVGNVSVTGASVSATANIHAAKLEAGNVSVTGASASLSADIGPGLAIGNVSVTGFSAGISADTTLKVGNFSIGTGVGIDLNPLNWFLNFGLGGGGGGGGGGGDRRGSYGGRRRSRYEINSEVGYCRNYFINPSISDQLFSHIQNKLTIQLGP